MKVKLLKNMGVDGKHCARGDVVEVSELDGHYLVNRGHAALAKDAETEKKDAETEKKGKASK